VTDRNPAFSPKRSRTPAHSWDGKSYGYGVGLAHPIVETQPCPDCGAQPGELCRGAYRGTKKWLLCFGRNPNKRPHSFVSDDLAIGYRAGQEDSVATRHLVEIVRLDAIASESGEYEDFHAVTLAIKAAREVLKKRKAVAR
jgi:hypothetical protein